MAIFCISSVFHEHLVEYMKTTNKLREYPAVFPKKHEIPVLSSD